MKFPSLWLAFLLLSSSMAVLAQIRPGGVSSGRGAGSLPGTSTPTAPSPSAASPTSTAAFLSGKVALDDGSELSDSAAIQVTCRGQRHTEAYTDRRGNFSFQFASISNEASDVGDASATMMTRTSSSQEMRNWRDCEIQAVLPGYRSEVIDLSSRMSTLESVDLGRITLHRLEHVEGTSISVTSAMAPPSAKKALEKAREEEKKGKSSQAVQSLEKAVEIYPKFAVAWYELGRIQLEQHDVASAKHSFEQALEADSKYVNPYNNLAALAFQAGEWRQVADITNKLLSLNPVNFPRAYFYNGVARYYLGDMDAAEKIARQGMRVDEAHDVPQLQYLLGIILIKKHQYPQATEELEQYLNRAKQPEEIEQAKKQLAEIERLSAAQDSASAEEKK
ncbi:MAG TPA: tetratricopeptide repeat protein [Terriglobales bacterium]|nr:tetratricopeptide repeat protein [Terriglobales bacterium]